VDAAPSDMAIGNAPSEIAKLVIKIGLKRASASRIAEFRLVSQLFANSTIKIPFSY
jgi:hypothetical protein